MSMLQAVLFGGLFALCAWAIVSPRVHTGLACTAGLVCIALASLALLSTQEGVTPREVLLGLGITILAARAAWRHWRTGVDSLFDHRKAEP